MMMTFNRNVMVLSLAAASAFGQAPDAQAQCATCTPGNQQGQSQSQSMGQTATGGSVKSPGVVLGLGGGDGAVPATNVGATTRCVDQQGKRGGEILFGLIGIGGETDVKTNEGCMKLEATIGLIGNPETAALGIKTLSDTYAPLKTAMDAHKKDLESCAGQGGLSKNPVEAAIGVCAQPKKVEPAPVTTPPAREKVTEITAPAVLAPVVAPAPKAEEPKKLDVIAPVSKPAAAPAFKKAKTSSGKKPSDIVCLPRAKAKAAGLIP